MKTNLVVLLLAGLMLVACGKKAPVPWEAQATSAPHKARVIRAAHPAPVPSTKTASASSDDTTPDLAAVTEQSTVASAPVLTDAPCTQSDANTTNELAGSAPEPRPTLDELRSHIATLSNDTAVGACCGYAFSESFRNTNRYAIIALLEELFGRELNQRQSNAVHSSIAFQYYWMTQYEKALMYVDNSIGVTPDSTTPLLKNFCMAKRLACHGLLYALAKHRADYTPEEYRRRGEEVRVTMNATAALWFSIPTADREREMALYREDEDGARDYEGIDEEDHGTLQ